MIQLDMISPIAWVRHSQNGAELPFPEPDKCTVTAKKLSKDTAKRSLSYYLNPEYVGKDIIIHLEWNTPSFEEGSQILNTFDPDFLQGIWVKFYHVQYGWLIEEMVCSDVPTEFEPGKKAYCKQIVLDLTTKQTRWRG